MKGDLPHAVASSILKISDAEIRVHVLSDGRRMIESESVNMLLTKMARGELTAEQADKLARWIKGQADA